MDKETTKLKELHKEMTQFSNWLDTLKLTRINNLDLDLLLNNPDLLQEEMKRRKVTLIYCVVD